MLLIGPGHAAHVVGLLQSEQSDIISCIVTILEVDLLEKSSYFVVCPLLDLAETLGICGGRTDTIVARSICCCGNV